MPGQIRIVGARQHNLKNLTLELPREALVVITGLSGSGKSSLAFDTLYAEGQRRYVESLSAYARQFLDRLQKPDVDHIEGLSPAIAIEQRSTGNNPRSTVATTTEIHDYLRLLYAHLGTPHCPECGRVVRRQSPQAIVNRLLGLPADRRLVILAPYVRGRRGAHADVVEQMRKDGFVRARIDGRMVALEDDIALDRAARHTLEAVVDRLKTGATTASRLTDSVELALRLGQGLLVAMVEDSAAPGGWHEELFSEHLACADCGISLGELQPRDFSFNNPYGACPRCHGLGTVQVIQIDRLIPDPSRAIGKDAMPVLEVGPRRVVRYHQQLVASVLKHLGVDPSTAWRDVPAAAQRVLLEGSGTDEVLLEYSLMRRHHRVRRPFEGLVPLLTRRWQEAESETLRERLEALMEAALCPDCRGARLKPAALAVLLGGQSIHGFAHLSIERALQFLDGLDLSVEAAAIGHDLVKEIRARLGFLQAVGLGYLSLDRASASLSGGEAQRIRLATQVGTGLVGVLYILDEPSIGLHQRDNERLLATLRRLRDLGNTVIVVEHDLATMAQADYIVDLGPGAGRHGGELVCAGTPAEVSACERSLTGQYLSGRRRLELPTTRHPGNGLFLEVRGATEHNLKGITARLPLGTLCCVTGVSGSGKSTLVEHILRRAVSQALGLRTAPPGAHAGLGGIEHIDKMIVIDQAPIGRTPRSNPATYIGAFDTIRDLFARVPEARVRGYTAGRFSFNVKGGRCEECRGDGLKKIEMQFLPDVYVRCEACQGRRYNQETLNVRYRGRSIADVLDMTITDGHELFAAVPRLKRQLGTLCEVGLGYLRLGQAATTLSGGEAQRVKLAAELARHPSGHTLYILDEPTTGLHLADVENLMGILMRLRDQGNTVLVIEHHLDVIKAADHVLDLGPEGGEAGGRIVAEGTPEAVAACPASHTGRFLRPLLGLD
ncbi:MAG: excinuclease ABC subunit UvrA [Lentisphaerae bacterium]|nr:excinuclease ABC subunit UvrA [Lentisphaerota bacterium]